MPDVAELKVKVSADTADLQAGLARANQGVSTFAASAGKMGASAASAGNQIAQVGALIGGSLAAGVGLAVKSAAELQTSIAKISTIKPDIDTSKVTNSVQQMSTRVAQSSAQLASSLYNVFSSIEVSQEGALALTEKFGRGAVAAQTDAETFGTSVLGVMNAYKLSVSDADHISDVFFNTVNKGVITGDELAHNLGNVTQSAKNAGVGFDTLGALIAGVTKEGGEASVNVNNLNNVLQKLVTADVQSGLEKMGVATKDASGNFRDIIPVLTDLKAKLDTLSASDRAAALQNLFPDAQARTGITTLLSQLDTVTQVANENAKALGVADKAYATMGQTASSQAIILKNTVLATLTQFGTEALPGLISITGQVQKLAAAFGEMPAPAKHAVVVGAELAAVFLLVGSASIKLVTTAVEVGGALKTVGTAAATSAKALATYATSAEAATLATTALPPLLIAAGLAAAGTAITMDLLTKGTQKAADAIGGDLGKAIAGIDISKLDALKAFLTGVDVAAGKAAQTTKEWAAAQSDAALMTTYLASVQRAADLERAGKTGTELNDLQAVNNALRAELATRRELTKVFQEQATAQRLADSQKEPPNAAPLTAYEQAVQKLVLAGQQIAPTFSQAFAIVQQMGGAAGSSVGSVDELSAAYFTNRDAALAVAAAEATVANNQALVGHFNALSTELQGVTTSAQPMQAALDLLNQKVAAGIPLTAEQAYLLSTLPGYIAGATSGYDGLVTSTAQAQIAIQNSNSAAGGAGTAFGGLTDQASVLTGNLNALSASAIAVEAALGALGTQNSKLSSEYNILNERIVALQEQQKSGVGLTQQETTELATLTAARDKLGQEIGGNTAQMRDLILQQIADDEATKAATASKNGYIAAMGKLSQAHGEARNGLVGLTDGFGNVTTASGSATGAISGGGVAAAAAAVKVATLTIGAAKLKIAVGEIPTAHATEVTTPGAAEAKTAVESITTAISNVPKSFNVTATVDISGALASIQTLSNSMPHSPAKEGPLSVLPNWMALFEELPSAAAKAGAEAASAVAKAITDVLGAMKSLANFDFVNDSPTGDDMGWFAHLTSSLIATMQDAASSFSEEALKAVSDFSDTVGKVGGSIKNAVEGLVLLGTTKWADVSPDGNAMGWFMHLVSSLVENFRQAAESFDADGLAEASTFAETVGKVTGVLKTATDGLSALRAFVAPAEAVVSRFMASLSDLMEKFGTWAGGFESDGLVQSGIYAEAVGKVTGVLKTATDGLAALLKFTPPAEANVSRFMASLSDLMEKFGTWAGGFEADGLAQSSIFAEAVGKVTSVLDNGVKGLDALKGFVAPAEAAVSTFLTSLSDLMEKFGTWAGGFEADGLAAAATFAESAGKVVAVVGPAVDGFAKLANLTAPSESAISALAAGIRAIVQKFADMASMLDSDGIKATGDFAAAANAALGAAKTGVELFAAMAGDKDKAGNNQPIGIPSATAIDQLMAGIRYVVAKFTQMASEMQNDGIKQMQTFAAAAGQVLAAAKSGTDLFKQMEKLAVPSEAAIDYLLGTIGLIISKIRLIAAGIGTDGLAEATAFATGSFNVISTLANGLKLFDELAKFKDIPATKLEELWKALEGALDFAHKLFERAEAIKAEAASFADSMREAARLFAQGMSLGNGMGGVPSGDWVPGNFPALAAGGIVTKPTLAMIGEAGPEAIVPLSRYQRGGGGGGVTVQVTVQGNVYGVDHMQDVVFTALQQGVSRGRRIPA